MRTTTARDVSPGFRLLAVSVIVGSVAVRFALLGRQSYWIDELFSVSESDTSFRSMVRLGSAEVHTPLYAALLWAWMRLGGPGEAWTRTLSTVCATAAVLVAHRGLRGLGLSGHVRWALTVATAAGATSIVYSLETRNYALLGLGAVGLTVATLRAALLTLDGEEPSRADFLAWTGWAVLAATAHLFGAVLALSALVVLAAATLVRGPRPRSRLLLFWTACTAVGCSGQVAWLVLGIGRPGFASGTSWIGAPRAGDLRDLLTTTFGSGGLVAHRDGFAWTSGVGLTVAVTGCLAAAVAGVRERRQRGAGPVPTRGPAEGRAVQGRAVQGRAVQGRAVQGRAAEGRAAAVLLGLALVLIVVTYGIAQRLHLWTLRNLSVVAPALVWGVVCLAAAAAGTQAGRRTVATVAVGLLGVGLVPVAGGLAAPYKTDFRGVFSYLGQVRADDPGAVLVFAGHGPPLGWGPVDGPLRAADAGLRPRGPDPLAVASPADVVRSPGTQVVVLYRGVADRNPEPAAAQLAGRLGPRVCRPLPFHGLAVVRCG